MFSSDVHTNWPMVRAVLQEVTDHRLVGEAQDVVEVLLCVLRVTAGVGPPSMVTAPFDRNRLLSAYAICAASVNASMKTRSTLSGNSSTRFSKPV